MRKSYGVVWRTGAGSNATGRLGLLPLGLRLEGLVDGAPSQEEIRYENMTAVRVGRSTEERIDGRPTVVIERGSGPATLVSTVAQPSLVGEIVEELASLLLGTGETRRTAVIVPIKPESHAAVRALAAEGPPFDPERTLGLDRHEVFVTPHEAVFVFETQAGVESLETLLEDPSLWQAAAGWREHVAGPPRIATAEYAWARPADGLDPAAAPRP